MFERPLHGLRSLLGALRGVEGGGDRDGERAGGERVGDGLGGGRTGITIKQPLTAHTTPEQLTEELQRWGGVREWAAD